MDCIDELEQKVRGILGSKDTDLQPYDLQSTSISARNNFKHGYFKIAVEKAAKVVRACELLGDNNTDRQAFELCNLSRYIDSLFNSSDYKYIDAMFERENINNLYLLYAELNETAAGLFQRCLETGSSEKRRYKKSLAHSFRRAALGYALAGNAEKANDYLEKSDKHSKDLHYNTRNWGNEVRKHLKRASKKPS